MKSTHITSLLANFAKQESVSRGGVSQMQCKRIASEDKYLIKVCTSGLSVDNLCVEAVNYRLAIHVIPAKVQNKEHAEPLFTQRLDIPKDVDRSQIKAYTCGKNLHIEMPRQVEEHVYHRIIFIQN